MSNPETTPTWAQEPGLSIRRKAIELKRRDSAERHAALLAISEKNQPAFEAIYRECEETCGHSFTVPRGYPNMFGDVPLLCANCGMKEP